MSASDKKKLRKEQNAAAMTERQLKEKKEAKKLKGYTITFVVAMALVVVIALGTVIGRAVDQSGVLDRNTHALTVDSHELASAELSYFYMDAINNWYSQVYSQYGSYTVSLLPMMGGPDLTQPLDDQVYDVQTNKSWGDYFVEQAIASAKSTYALYDLAVKDSHKLTEDEQETLDTAMESLNKSAADSKVSVTKYLQSTYGYGSTEETFKTYSEICALAMSYYNAHQDSLTYDDAAMREYEKDIYNEYSSYSYVSFPMNYTDFREGGTKDAEGNTTYTDAENEAAREAVKEAAKKIAEDSSITSQELLDKALKALAPYEKKETLSTVYEDTLYASVTEAIREWVTSKDRKEGDLTYIANTTTSKDADGKETTITNGYYVVLFTGSTENKMPLANVRHILVNFEGGTTDSSGNKTYSEAEKNKAKEEAEALLKQWQDGDATEAAFEALAKEKTDDDGSKENGGLYEDVYPGQMVTNFNDWCFEEGRKTGDTGVVETEYGYHVMYYVGDSDLTFRDYMIQNDMRAEDMEEWYESVLEPVTVTEHNLSHIDRDLVLFPGY